MTGSADRPLTPLWIALAWAFVGIPWLWGIAQTLGNAAALFE